MIYDFEDGVFPAAWINDTLRPWVVTTNDSYAGSYSLRSDPLSTLVNCGITDTFVESTLTIRYRLSCKATDALYVYIDGIEVVNVSGGEGSWVEASFPVAAGNQSILFYHGRGSGTDEFDNTIYLDEISIIPVSIDPPGTYTFEDAQFPSAISTGPSLPWVITAVDPSSGSYSVKSTSEGVSSSNSDMVLADTFVASTFSFDYKVSSEIGVDRLIVYLDGAIILDVSGVVPWSNSGVIVLPAGARSILFRYEKNSSVDSGDDFAGIDNIIIVDSAIDPAGTYSFESGVFPSAFVNDATHPWTITPVHAETGSYSLKSNIEGINTATSFSITDTYAVDTNMAFGYKVSSQAVSDTLTVTVDGSTTALGQVSGEVDWSTFNIILPAGTRTVVFTYNKDATTNSGDDAAYIDNIIFTTYVAPPSVDGPFDFEDTLVPSAFDNDPTYPWVNTLDDSYSGTRSIKANHNFTHSTQSYLTLEGTFTGGEFSFWYKVSSEGGYDKFSFTIDANPIVSNISGESGWVHVITTVSPGVHTMKWGYYKDSSVSNGADTVYIDDIKFLGVVTPPIVNELMYNSADIVDVKYSDEYGVYHDVILEMGTTRVWEPS